MFGRRKRTDRRERRGASAAGGARGREVATIDDENFLASTEGGFTVVAFWAPWCSPCRAFAPVFDDVAAHADERVRFARCDTEESRVTATMLQITTIPTVIVFGPDGNQLGRIVGLPRRSELEQVIAELAP